MPVVRIRVLTYAGRTTLATQEAISRVAIHPRPSAHRCLRIRFAECWDNWLQEFCVCRLWGKTSAPSFFTRKWPQEFKNYAETERCVYFSPLCFLGLREFGKGLSQGYLTQSNSLSISQAKAERIGEGERVTVKRVSVNLNLRKMVRTNTGSPWWTERYRATLPSELRKKSLYAISLINAVFYQN